MERSDPSAWWIDPEARIALLSPQVMVQDRQSGEQAVLCLQGHIRSGGRNIAPKSWPALPPADTQPTPVLYDILERESLALKDLRGQWALACWDGRNRRLLLARDHQGQRVLFTRTEPDLFIFCSELSPLLQTPEASCDLDLEAAGWYLLYGMPPLGRTLARGVGRLPAAHWISCEPLGAPSVQRYWTPLNWEFSQDAAPETIASIQESLDQSIADHCTRDDPQGIFLSGGTDSTYLATTAASLKGMKLTAFTSAFEESLGMNDDVHYARTVAEWLGITHHVVPLHADRALEILERSILTADEPCAAWASMTHYQLLVTARELGISRMLSGLGADEIFGGYPHFHEYYVRFLEYSAAQPTTPGADDFDSLLQQDDSISRWTLFPGIPSFFDVRSLPEGLAALAGPSQHRSHTQNFYLECRRLKPGAHLMEMMVAHECQHRIPDLLFANFESISRQLGIEVSYPFLDPDVVQRAASLDVLSRYRTPSGNWSADINELQPGFKHALMLVYEKKVPELVLRRPIKTFTAPFGAWFANPHFAKPLLARMERSRFWQRKILPREWLDEALQQMSLGPKDESWTFQLWGTLTLIGWYDHFVDPPSSR
jgi:asparagine synthase (glutamine-hydrolysing)